MLGTGLASDEVKAKKHVLSSLGAYSQVREKGLWMATLPCTPCSAREAQVWPRCRGAVLAVGDRNKAVSYLGKERVKTLQAGELAQAEVQRLEAVQGCKQGAEREKHKAGPDHSFCTCFEPWRRGAWVGWVDTQGVWLSYAATES